MTVIERIVFDDNLDFLRPVVADRFPCQFSQNGSAMSRHVYQQPSICDCLSRNVVRMYSLLG